MGFLSDGGEKRKKGVNEKNMLREESVAPS